MKLKRKTNNGYEDPDSVLKTLPVAVLTLALSLPNNDRYVLAYLLARSLLTTIKGTSSSSSDSVEINKCESVKKRPFFECGCFDCYTSFWYRWDSSPNRELIHQVIEAFEEHLMNSEFAKKKPNRCKKRGGCEKVVVAASLISVDRPEFEVVVSPEKGVTAEEVNLGEMEVVTVQSQQSMGAAKAKHKGFARKVLPDVVGLLNSRLWSFWSPGA